MVVLAMFREPLSWLIKHVRRLSWGSASAELTDQASEMADEALALPEARPIAEDIAGVGWGTTATGDSDSGARSVELDAAPGRVQVTVPPATSPVGGTWRTLFRTRWAPGAKELADDWVFTSWTNFEVTCEMAARQWRINLAERPPGMPAALYIVTRLHERGLVGREVVDVTTQLAELRNRFAHAPEEASLSAVYDFKFTADRLTGYVKGLLPPTEREPE
ncbi:MAG: hypothetical protein ACJ74O_13620 [Frankiaceae bacterium]